MKWRQKWRRLKGWRRAPVGSFSVSLRCLALSPAASDDDGFKVRAHWSKGSDVGCRRVDRWLACLLYSPCSFLFHSNPIKTGGARWERMASGDTDFRLTVSAGIRETSAPTHTHTTSQPVENQPRWNVVLPRATGDSISKLTRAAPWPIPMRVRRPASPPKAAAFSRSQWTAATTSSIP